MKNKKNIGTDWRESDINVDSLWIIDKRDRGGKHSNVYHGNFIPQIPQQYILDNIFSFFYSRNYER